MSSDALALRETPRTPITFYLSQAIGILVYIVVANPLSRVVIGLVFVLYPMILVTAPLRETMDSRYFSVLSLAVYLLVSGNLLRLLKKHPALQNWGVGRPAFGEFGGAPVSLLQAALKGYRHLDVTFSPDQMERYQHFRSDEERVLEALVKGRYEAKLRASDPDLSDEEIEERWETYWPALLDSVRYQDTSLLDTRDDEKQVEFSVVTGTLLNLSRAVFPLSALVSLILMVTIIGFVRHDVTLVTVARLMVLSGIAIAVPVFATLYLGMDRIHVVLGSEPTPDEVPNAAVRELISDYRSAWDGTYFVPQKVEIEPPLLRALRGFYARGVLTGMYTDAVGILAATFSVFCLAFIWNGGLPGEVTHWYRNLSIGLLLLPAGLLLTYFIIFHLALNLRSMVFTAISGVGGLLAPPAIKLLVNGQMPQDVDLATQSIAAGVVSALMAALISALKPGTG